MFRRGLPSAAATGTSARLSRDPGLVALAVFLLIAALTLALTGPEPASQAVAYWALQAPLDAALCWLSWQVWRNAGTAPRRFWFVLSAGALLWAAGDLAQVVAGARGQGSLAGGPFQQVGLLVGAVALILVMMSYPSGTRGEARGRTGSGLDTATSMFGGAVLAWTFTVHRADGGSALLAGVAGVAVMLTAGFAAMRFGLSRVAPLSPGAAGPMMAAVVLSGATTLLPAPAGSGLLLLWPLAPLIGLVSGARIQLLLARARPDTFAPRARKAYSALPYVSVVAGFACVLVTVSDGHGARSWGAVAGTAVATGLVLVRQFLTLRENAALVERLDTSLGTLREQEARLRELASTDVLTRLANRSVFSAETQRLLPSRPALLLIDLDDFKDVNDVLGHPAGDELLVLVADRMRAWAPPGALIARLGGDEFAVLMPGLGAAEATRAATALLRVLAAPAAIAGKVLLVSASMGLAVPQPGEDVDGWLSNADIALYEAKRRNKGICVLYTPDMGQRATAGAELADRLRDGLARGEFSLAYQPIVELDTGATVGLEALLRWTPPGGTERPAADFIATAVDTEVIVPVGRWALFEACRQLAAWRRLPGSPPGLTLSVNAAVRQLRDPDFVTTVNEALASNGLPPALLTIDVAEGAILDDEIARTTLDGLRALGVSVALDDFGTGLTSLGVLVSCPLTGVKLDRSVVGSVALDPRQAGMAKAVIETANALGLDAVAEGVETADQANRLRALSYRRAQGFLFAPPAAAEGFTRLWASDSGRVPSRR